MSYVKNTAGQGFGFAMVNASTGAADAAATVTAYRVLDGGVQAAVTGSVVNKGNGQYWLALSQADTNGNVGSYLMTAASDVPVEKTIVFENATLTFDANGAVKADVVDWLGTAVTAVTAGIPDVNAKSINSVSTSQVATINANIGTIQAIAFNANNLQKVSLNDILATALTETSGQLAGGFKQFFNVAAPTGTVNSLPNAAPGASGGVFIAGTNDHLTITNNFLVSGTTTHTGTFVCNGGVSFNGVAASGSTPATAGLTINGGAASTTAGGTAAPALSVVGGVGAASTNGAATGAIFAGGGTNTVASAADGITCTASSNGNGLTLTHAGAGKDFNATTTSLILTKTTNITGFNDIAATAVVSGGAITTSGGAVSTVTTVTNQPTAAQFATAVLTDTTASDLNVAGSIGNTIVHQLGGAFTSPSSSVFTVAALTNAPGGAGGYQGPSAAQIATAVLTDTADVNTPGSIGFLANNVPYWYFAPDNASIAAIKAKINQMQFDANGFLKVDIEDYKGQPAALGSSSSVSGNGQTPVDHNYGGTNNLAYQTAAGLGIAGAFVAAYLKSDYDAGNRGPGFIIAQTVTIAGGAWANPLMLNAGTTYTLVFYGANGYGPNSRNITV